MHSMGMGWIGESAGKSGARFYLTADGAMIIKTIEDEEVGAMLRMLSEYYSHVKANTNTCLHMRACIHACVSPYSRACLYMWLM